MANGTKPSVKDLMAIIVGAIVLIVYVAALFYMTQKLCASDLVWARATYLLTGVEAIAFSAAGFFFGREVNRQRAEKAEEAETEAQGKADIAVAKAAQAEAKGHALATAIRSQAQQPQQVSFGAQTENQSAYPNASYLANLADKLFPA